MAPIPASITGAPEAPATAVASRVESGGYRTGTTTKNRILDAAERLFAARPYNEVSIRDLTTAANVSLAAVNYHFGSKQALLKAAFLRRMKELNRERLTLLAEAEARAGSETVPLDEVLYALLAPPLRWAFDPAGGRVALMRFIARQALHDSPLRDVFTTDVQHVRKFSRYLARAAPSSDRQTLFWRLHFTLGALHTTITDHDRLQSMSDGSCGTPSPEEVTARLIAFAAAGFRQSER